MLFRNDLLKKLIEESMWSITALAKKLGVKRTTIYNWIKGAHAPSDGKTLELARIFNITAAEFIIGNTSQPENIKAPKQPDNFYSIAEALDNNVVLSKLAAIDNLASNIRSTLKKNAFILNSVIEANPHSIYIKNIKQQYIIANRAFRDALKLPDNFIIQGKRDENLFSQEEAIYNTKEDIDILASGKHVYQEERIFPGTRQKRYCLVSKEPLFFDNRPNQLPAGILATFVDITQKKKNDLILNVIKENLIMSDWVFIWMASEKLSDKFPYRPEKLIYFQTRKSRTNEYLGKNLDEIYDLLINELIVDESMINLDFRLIKDKPIVIEFKSRDFLDRDTVYKIREVIGFNHNHKVYYGIATFAD